jgi:TRAP-type mannitol/chloroaromatic compound transport system permease small subunit
LNRFIKVVNKINEIVAQFIALLIFPMIAFTVYEVSMRYLFDRPSVWVFETTLFLFGASVVLGGGWVLKIGGHVGMDVFYIRQSRRTRAILDVITSFLFFAFVGVLLIESTDMAWEALVRNTHSSSAWGPVLFPIIVTIPIGAFLMLIQGITKFISDLYLIFTGKELVGEVTK